MRQAIGCSACGKRGADVRPNFSEGKKPAGYQCSAAGIPLAIQEKA